MGVAINANMTVSEQCRITASQGNQIIGMIRRNIMYKERGLIVYMYKGIVRYHLEYCIQAWRPYLRKDIYMLEKYKGATKLTPGLKKVVFIYRNIRSVGPLKALYTFALPGRHVHSDTNSASPGSILVIGESP